MATSPSDNQGGVNQPLISEFAQDADMTELIEYFLTELQGGVDNLTRAWQEGNSAQLRKLAHQLKGAAGGYGFPTITASAAELETLLDAGMAQTSAFAEQFEALIALCKRASV